MEEEEADLKKRGEVIVRKWETSERLIPPSSSSTKDGYNSDEFCTY